MFLMSTNQNLVEKVSVLQNLLEGANFIFSEHFLKDKFSTTPHVEVAVLAVPNIIVGAHYKGAGLKKTGIA
jgi:hypothetical protein